MKKFGSVYFVALLFVVLASCNREDTPDPDPVMLYATDMQCKFQTPLKGDTPGVDQSCVSWNFEEDTLYLTHYNAGFNCCPEKILTSFRISGDTLYVTERDSLQLCRCNCLYDIDYKFANLNEQAYILHFDEPFVIDPKEPLEFEIDLKNEPTGKFCQNRDYYPWGI